MKKIQLAILMLLLLAANLNNSFAQGSYHPLLDSLFGIDGLLETNFLNSTDDLVKRLYVFSDDKILASGYMWTNNNDIALAKYLKNGEPDLSFGNNGQVVFENSSFQDMPTDLSLQDDGKIVIFGYNWQQSGAKADIVVMRFLANGRIDSSFATNGLAGNTPYYLDGANCGIVLKSKKIIAAGLAKTPNDAYLICLNPDGSYDNNFAANGIYRLDLGKNEEFNTIGEQSDGKIIVGGVMYDPYQGLVLRLNSDGTLDPSFGTAGIAYFDISPTFQERFRDLIVLPDDKILVAGIMSIPGKTISQDFMLFRLNKNGDIDNSFGDSGFVFTDFLMSSDDLKQIIIDKNGNILSTGLTTNPKMSDAANFAACRHLPNGKPDNSFGVNGKITIGNGSYINLFSYAIAFQSDDRILLGGSLQSRGGSYSNHWSIVRLNPNGTSDIPMPENYIVNPIIYPNPCKSKLFIEQPSVEKEICVQIYNIHGELVFTKNNCINNKIELTTDALVNGLYLLVLKSEKEIRTFKFIKNNLE